MIDPVAFKNLHLQGGFIITEVGFANEPMDALNREALAQTRINAHRFYILLQAGMSEQEISVSLYHEVLEAATVASLRPPDTQSMGWPRPRTSTVCCDPMDFRKNKTVIDRNNIQMDLIKLVGGERLLRLTETRFGLSLEKKLDPQQPVARQKERLLGVFEAALARAELLAA